MAQIVIIHEWLGWGGGGAVAMNIAQALQDEHTLSLVTTRSKDVNDLNEYYSTNVTEIEIYEFSILDRIDKMGHLRVMKDSLLSRLVDTFWPNYDLVINTTSDIKVSGKSITYVHGPYQILERSIKERNHNGISKYYFRMCDYIESKEKKSPKFLANSQWTSNNVSDKINIKPSIVSPPVYTDDIEPIEWKERRNDILTIGRLSPEKNILRNIKIVERIRERGHKVQYHIVGPKSEDRLDYVSKVEREARKHDFVHLEGKIEREKLSSMISSFKWGLHGHDCEHFGITVAELVSGGVIPFVPNDGGQIEIVNFCNKVTYESEEEAAAKLDKAMKSDERVRKIKYELHDMKNKFGVRRFREEIKHIVERYIESN